VFEIYASIINSSILLLYYSALVMILIAMLEEPNTPPVNNKLISNEINLPFWFDLSQYSNSVFHIKCLFAADKMGTYWVFFVSSISWNTTHPDLGFRVNNTEFG
jgi:hypothetical protein